jgi:hypothetical protein
MKGNRLYLIEKLFWRLPGETEANCERLQDSQCLG